MSRVARHLIGNVPQFKRNRLGQLCIGARLAVASSTGARQVISPAVI